LAGQGLGDQGIDGSVDAAEDGESSELGVEQMGSPVG
jgi:hypothetical protein